MCGIFAFLSDDTSYSPAYTSHRFGRRLEEMRRAASTIAHRGPDMSSEWIRSSNGLSAFLAFHRLAINDLTSAGNQPMTLPDDDGLILICNGEIYNYRELASEYGIQLQSHSDCEIILHLYRLFGFRETIEKLKGYFAMVLIDYKRQLYYIGRDPIGVRSLFMGTDNNGDVVVASEVKALLGLNLQIFNQFPPGHYYDSHNKLFTPYYQKPVLHRQYLQPKEWTPTIRNYLVNAVRRCLSTTDRPVGCLLSGGLDSSLITGIASRLMHEKGQRLRTFSVGMQGSVDLKYARQVAEYLNTDHTELIVSPEELLEAIPETIRQIETCDTTTIRASTPMLLLCKYIKRTTDIAVILSGEGSDEVCGSYMYFHKAPSPQEFDDECRRLISELSWFDVLRCDKCTAGAGLEVRVPFLNEEFRNYYLSIPAEYRMPRYWGMEKYLLRQAFEGTSTIPDSVLWRPKEGMSDGVSSNAKSWYQIIQEHVETISVSVEVKHGDSPKTKEAMWFRQIFDGYYGELEKSTDAVFRHYWLPRWSGDISEPSARVLDVYRVS